MTASQSCLRNLTQPIQPTSRVNKSAKQLVNSLFVALLSLAVTTQTRGSTWAIPTAAERLSAPTAVDQHGITPVGPVKADLTGDTTTAFDATRAWAEFDQLLRERYGYFKRPGVDGDSILRYFEPAAKRVKTKKDFIDILQVVAHNFADPHFIVGPFDSTDYSIIPTSADLYAQYRSGVFRLVDVRQDSDAQAQGLRPGATILTIDGRSPTAAIETIMGRPISSLSTTQINTGLNIALAGIRNQARTVQIKSQPAKQTYTLRPTAELVKQLRTDSLLRVDRRGDVGIIRFNNSLGNNQTITAFKTALLRVLDTRVLILDFRNTPSGGNTTVSRGIMGHFVKREMPYQVHTVPFEEYVFGVPRKFVEYVLPITPYYAGRVVALGGYWTGSMGEGLLIGFDAIGAKTAGAGLADLLGALFNETLATSSAKVDMGEEMLFHINGQPRESFVPAIYLEAPEGRLDDDPLVELVIRKVR